MIRDDQLAQALRVVQRLIIHAKAQAQVAGQDPLAQLLNDIELLPEFLADESDRSGEFSEMLHSIVQANPSCRYIVEEFELPAARSDS